MIDEKTYFIPQSVEEALTIAKSQIGEFKYIAGGTDVMVNRYQNTEESPCLVDITKIKELKEVKEEAGYLKIGALVTLHGLKNHLLIVNEFPALIEAAHAVGSPLIRKSATLGGNVLCENRCIYYNQSEWWREAIGYCLKCEGDICIATKGKKACFAEFISDTVPVLISMNAELEIADVDGGMKVKLESIYTGDGVDPRNLSKTAIIKSILLPLGQNFRTVFKKLRQRESVEFTSLTTAVTVDKDSNLNISMAGVDPKPIIIRESLKSNKDELIIQAVKRSRAIDNDMFSRVYRRKMIKLFLEKSFVELEIE